MFCASSDPMHADNRFPTLEQMEIVALRGIASICVTSKVHCAQMRLVLKIARQKC